MSDSIPRIAALVCYRPEHYERIKEIMDDGDKLPETFEKWRQRSNAPEAAFERQGIKIVRVYLDPDEFMQWCKARGMNLDAKARNEYAGTIASEAYKRGEV